MNLLSSEYLPYLLVALIAGAIIGFLLLRPRQRVRLSDTSPTRPHMVARDGAAIDAGTQPGLATIANHPATAEGADDFERMKGVGSKFAEALRAKGYLTFEQLAALDPAEIARLDEELGAFRGRLARDRIPEQARFLAEHDLEGFQKRFGKL